MKLTHWHRFQNSSVAQQIGVIATKKNRKEETTTMSEGMEI